MEDFIREEIIENYLNPLSQNGLLKKRINAEEGIRSREDGEFQRDYTRIMYSSSFRRLQGKMQLFGIKSDQFFRNRLTHSLEVAQIARSIATIIGYPQDEIYIVEAGALAHDIGNPPFGHAGERYLNEISKDFGGFEGNAQTLRILTTVEKKRANFRGLNLTYRTLFSVVKYFNQFNAKLSGDDYNEQKFLYNDDFEILDNIANDTRLLTRTLDVQIVDLADEIAYAAHDLEDGLRQRIFTTDELAHDFHSMYGSCDAYGALLDILQKSKDRASHGQTNMDSSEFSKLYRKELTSKIINVLIHDISLIEVTDEQREKTATRQSKELGFKNLGHLAKGLKKTTFNCINHNDEVYSYEQRGKRIIESLYNFYLKENKYLPPEYRAQNVNLQYNFGFNPEKDNEGKFKNKNMFNLQRRLIVDYISGMMDDFAISTYEKYDLKNIIGVNR